MNKIFISAALLFAMMAVVVSPAAVSAQVVSSADSTTVATTTTVSNTTPDVTGIAGLLARIQELTKILAELKARISQTQTEVSTLKESLKTNLKMGVSDEDVKKIQEVLASDSSIYPEGLTTGYFGPLTNEALKRFQAKFGLTVTGEINTETRAALDTILNERKLQGRLPYGLLNAPGLRDKFKKHFESECEQEDYQSSVDCTNMKKDKNDDQDKEMKEMKEKKEKKESDSNSDNQLDGDANSTASSTATSATTM